MLRGAIPKALAPPRRPKSGFGRTRLFWGCSPLFIGGFRHNCRQRLPHEGGSREVLDYFGNEIVAFFVYFLDDIPLREVHHSIVVLRPILRGGVNEFSQMLDRP